jgi:hypothetical protein
MNSRRICCYIANEHGRLPNQNARSLGPTVALKKTRDRLTALGMTFKGWGSFVHLALNTFTKQASTAFARIR